MKLKIKKLIPDLDLRYHSDGASGIDIPAPYDIEFDCFGLEIINCGFMVEIPFGYEGQIRGRSSNIRNSLFVYPGTIDSDYRGEIRLCVNRFFMGKTLEGRISIDSDIHQFRRNKDVALIQKGERIAQLVICPVQRCEIEVVDELSTTKRGNGGFGSTGK